VPCTLYPGGDGRQSRIFGDCLRRYQRELNELFNLPKQRLPSDSTIRWVLPKLDYGAYSAALARFFGIEPLPGETLAVDGKVCRGSYQLETDNPASPLYPCPFRRDACSTDFHDLRRIAIFIDLVDWISYRFHRSLSC